MSIVIHNNVIDLNNLSDIKNNIMYMLKRDLVLICIEHRLKFYKSWLKPALIAVIKDYIKATEITELENQAKTTDDSFMDTFMPNPTAIDDDIVVHNIDDTIESGIVVSTMVDELDISKCSHIDDTVIVSSLQVVDNPIPYTNNILDIFNQIDPFTLNELFIKCVSLRQYCVDNGKKIIVNNLINIFIFEFMSTLYNVTRNANSIYNMNINNTDIIFKFMQQKSKIVLKNMELDVDGNHFKHTLVIMIITTSQWWKTKLNHTNIINSGIYVIDKQWCNELITFGPSCTIQSEDIYSLIQKSIAECTNIPCTYDCIQLLPINITNIFI